MNRQTIRAVGAIIRDRQGRLLLVQRANHPGAGMWSLPGGRVQPGEDDATALAREVAEETGLAADVGRLVGTVEREAGGGAMYVINDYACTVDADRSPAPGDDAADAGWFSPAEVRALPTTPHLVEALESWGVLRPG
ncbi:MAG: NUDIX hydrolase [Actinomycetota bacterium]